MNLLNKLVLKAVMFTGEAYVILTGFGLILCVIGNPINFSTDCMLLTSQDIHMLFTNGFRWAASGSIGGLATIYLAIKGKLN